MQMSERIFVQWLFLPIVLFANLSFGQITENGEVGYDEHFDCYRIPHELRKEEVGLFLQRMHWQWTVAQKDDWRSATVHPARFGHHCDWSKINLYYKFYSEDTPRKYYLKWMWVSHSDGFHRYSDLRFRGYITFYPDGRAQTFEGPIFRMSFDDVVEYYEEVLNTFYIPVIVDITNLERENEIKWNNEGKIVFDDYKAHGENFWDDVIPTTNEIYLSELKKYFAGLKEANEPSNRDLLCTPITIGAKDRQIEVRSPNDAENYEPLFKNCIDFFSTLESGSVNNLLRVSGFDANEQFDATVRFYFNNDMVFDVTVVRVFGLSSKLGRYLMFDDNGELKLWLEGSLDVATTPETFSNQAVKYRVSDGIEVKFHATGYPASYKTIVRNRLFGRQIEWDEEGNVLSDVDLDIPMPWADAPKPALKSEGPVVEDETPVLETPPPTEEPLAEPMSPPVAQPQPESGSILVPVLVTLAILVLLAVAAFFALKWWRNTSIP